ncbi:MAG: hypothetical protein JXQ73_15550 [Phycisphaerae bacterium]|nr:hypothetical protein [Phycisphaerae bacterium]
MVETKPSQGQGGQPSRRIGRSLAALTLGWAVVVVLLHVVPMWPGAPYNVRELLARRSPAPAAALFGLALTWGAFAPAWVAIQVLRRPILLVGLPLWAVGISLASWGLLRECVTPESWHDVLGTPVLGWTQEAELIFRFLALHGGAMLVLILGEGTVLAVDRREVRWGLLFSLRLVLFTMPGLILARLVVIDWAATDNLTELVRTGPVPGEPFLAILMLLIGANAALLGRIWTRPSAIGIVVGLSIALVAVAAGWGLLRLGLEPEVTQAGRTFPAVRFLLGPDRLTSLSQVALFLRWTALQVSATLLLSLGVFAACSLSPRDKLPEATGV